MALNKDVVFRWIMRGGRRVLVPMRAGLAKVGSAAVTGAHAALGAPAALSEAASKSVTGMRHSVASYDPSHVASRGVDFASNLIETVAASQLDQLANRVEVGTVRAIAKGENAAIRALTPHIASLQTFIAGRTPKTREAVPETLSERMTRLGMPSPALRRTFDRARLEDELSGIQRNIQEMMAREILTAAEGDALYRKAVEMGTKRVRAERMAFNESLRKRLRSDRRQADTRERIKL